MVLPRKKKGQKKGPKKQAPKPPKDKTSVSSFGVLHPKSERKYVAAKVKLSKCGNRRIFEQHLRNKYNSLPNIAMMPDQDSGDGFVGYTKDDLRITDGRWSDESEDECLQIWYEEARCKPINHSDSELDTSQHRLKPIGKRIELVGAPSSCKWPKYLPPPLPDLPPEYKSNFDQIVHRQWIHYTHADAFSALKNEPYRLLHVPRAKQPTNYLSHLRLGFCVTYEGPCPSRSMRDECPLTCEECAICCHEYKCTCNVQNNYGWCMHLHAAVGCGQPESYSPFGADEVVYYHATSRTIQIDHLRAMSRDLNACVTQIDTGCYSVSYGKPAELCFVQRMSLQRDRDCARCQNYKKCAMCNILCQHMYLCDCRDYTTQRRICEHCHMVAMFEDEQSSGPKRSQYEQDFYDLSDLSEATDEEDRLLVKLKAYKKPLTVVSKYDNSVLCLRALHHTRGHSISTTKIEYYGFREDKQMHACKVFRGNGNGSWNVNYFTKKCQCTMPDQCIHCELCTHAANCDCQKPLNELCKHKHAVKRLLTTLNDKEADMTDRKKTNHVKMLTDRRTRLKKLVQSRRGTDNEYRHILKWTSKEENEDISKRGVEPDVNAQNISTTVKTQTKSNASSSRAEPTDSTTETEKKQQKSDSTLQSVSELTKNANADAAVNVQSVSKREKVEIKSIAGSSQAEAASSTKQKKKSDSTSESVEKLAETLDKGLVLQPTLSKSQKKRYRKKQSKQGKNGETK